MDNIYCMYCGKQGAKLENWCWGNDNRNYIYIFKCNSCKEDFVVSGTDYDKLEAKEKSKR